MWLHDLGACCICSRQPQLQGHPHLGVGHLGGGRDGRGHHPTRHTAKRTTQVHVSLIKTSRPCVNFYINITDVRLYISTYYIMYKYYM